MGTREHLRTSWERWSKSSKRSHCTGKHFRIVDVACGLSLKPKKCQIVPLCIAFSTRTTEFLQDEPDSHSLDISLRARYLYLWLGPAVTNEGQFLTPYDKCKKTACMIADSRACPSAGSLQYYNPSSHEAGLRATVGGDPTISLQLGAHNPQATMVKHFRQTRSQAST